MCGLSCNNCGCGNNSNNSCIWIILILLFCCGNNGLGSSDGCGSDNSCIWIIILLFLCGGFGNNSLGCNSCGNSRDNCGCC